MRSNNEKQIEEAWVEVLAHVYKAVDWKKVARNRSACRNSEYLKLPPTTPSRFEKRGFASNDFIKLEIPELKIIKLEIPELKI